MPSHKHWLNKIKNKQEDKAKKCKPVTAFLRYTIYNFVFIYNTQGSGGTYQLKNSTIMS